MADAYTHYSHVCYNTEFRRSRSNRFGIGRGPKIFWDAEVPLVYVHFIVERYILVKFSRRSDE